MNIIGRMIERAKSERASSTGSEFDDNLDIDVQSALAPLPVSPASENKTHRQDWHAQDRHSEGRIAPFTQTAINNAAETEQAERIKLAAQRKADMAQMRNSRLTAHDEPLRDNPLRDTEVLERSTLSQKKSILLNPAQLQAPNQAHQANLETANGQMSQIQNPQPHAVQNNLEPSEILKAQEFVTSLQNYTRRSIEQQQKVDVRIRGLSGALEQIALRLATYERMEGRLEGALKSNKDLKLNIEKRKELYKALELRLKTLEPQYIATRDSLETARADLSNQWEVIGTQKEKIAKFNNLLSLAATKVAKTDSSLAALTDAYKQLQKDHRDQAVALSNAKRQAIEWKKASDSVSQKLAVRSQDYEALHIEAGALRAENSDLRKQVLDSGTAFENARYDYQSQITTLKGQISRRDEENMAIKAQLETIKSQMEESGGISAHREREILMLRQSVEAERERVRETEARMVDKAHMSDMNARALERAKMEYEVLNEKYATALSDVEMLRSMALNQSDKLARYAEISGSFDPRETLADTSNSHRSSERGTEFAPRAQNVKPSEGGTFDPEFKLKAVANSKLTRA